MTDEATATAVDLWLGTCNTCQTRYQISDDDLIDAYPQLLLALDETDEFIANCAQCSDAVILARQITVVHPFAAWTVLPAATGCSMCGTEHDAGDPHNWHSLLYQYAFRSQEARAGRPERWPTIRDAMAHCAPEVKAEWIEALRERGVDV